MNSFPGKAGVKSFLYWWNKGIGLKNLSGRLKVKTVGLKNLSWRLKV